MKRIFALTAVLALTTAPVMAETFQGGVGGGVFGGTVQSHSSGGSFSNSSGISQNGDVGGAVVRNENSAGHMARAFGSYEGATNGRLT